MRPSRAVLILLVGCKQPADSGPTGTDDPPTVYAPGDCAQPVAGAVCGTLSVPERHGSGGSTMITLSVAVVPATSGNSETTPLVLFSGGPGADIFDLASIFTDAGPYAALNVDHDVVLLSERGTFGATPLLDCPELSEVDAVFDAPPEQRSGVRSIAYAECRDRLVTDGVDLAAYTNTQRAADVAPVLQALGYSHWHLWGVSGGAALVQTLVRDHPDGIASAMVDSGGFPDADMGAIPGVLIPNASQRYRRMFDECASDRGCSGAYPTFEADFLGLIDSLEASPRNVQVTHPITGETRDVQLDGDLLLQLYTNNMASVQYFPLVTEQALAGDYSVIDPLLPDGLVEDTGPGFADALYRSVFCSAIASRVDVDTTGALPEVVSALEPTVTDLLTGCDAWDVPDDPPGGPVTSDTIPILILEGMYDTNRPPEWGGDVAPNFDTAYLAEFGDRGHVVLGDCAASMMQAFMADPTRSPDTSCVPDHVDWLLP